MEPRLAAFFIGTTMNRIAIAVFAAVLGLGIMVQDADARRFGGGMSSGISRSTSITQRQAIPTTPTTPSQAAAPTSAGATAPNTGRSRWLGPLAGLAAGIGLAALFSQMGLGEGMGDIMMLIAFTLAVVFLVRWLMNKRQTNTGFQYASVRDPTPLSFQSTPIRASAPLALAASTTGAANTQNTTAAVQVPAGFDVDRFLRQAKLNFMRMQAANDRGDMDDIRQFTSPEMFGEIQLEYQERGRKTQQTDVIELNAGLLDVTDEATRQLASVRFSGKIREEVDAVLEAFSEVWHLSKPNDGSYGWSVVGIQQD